jgi:hypothetical protein
MNARDMDCLTASSYAARRLRLGAFILGQLCGQGITAFPAASRVSISELLGGTILWRSACRASAPRSRGGHLRMSNVEDQTVLMRIPSSAYQVPL